VVEKEKQLKEEKKSLAVILPVYRSTETVRRLVLLLKEAFEPLCRLHIVLVEDGNEPSVLAYLKENCLAEHVTLISLKKNYGQQIAVFCGLENVQNYDYVATMDDDLKHPVEVLLQLWEKIQEGYDLVYAVPAAAGEPGTLREYSLGSRMRDLLFSKGLHCPKGLRVSSFRIMSGTVAKEVVEEQRGRFFYFSAAALRKTRRVANVSYHVAEETTRTSGYNLWKRCCLFMKLVWYYRLALGGTKKVALYEIQAVYPRLMVLGGSQCQVHALQRAKKEGMYTVLADYTKCPVGALYADVHVPVSTFDWEGCMEAAKEYEVQGVMTMGTDQPVYTVAKVCEELSLPVCLTPEQALLVTNKKEMKRRMEAAGIPTVPWMLIDRNTQEEELRRLRPPYVIKPLDSQGQRGIYKLDTAKEVILHLEKTLAFSRCEEALVEEYYESEEMTVSGYIDKGQLMILTITDRLLYPDPVHIGVCIGHRFPSVHMGEYGKIKEISDALVKEFGLPEGPFYLQLLKGAQGIVVNELACRIGGAFEDVIIPWVTGFDLLDAVMKNALGHPVEVSGYKKFRCDAAESFASVQLMFCVPGEIAFVTPEEELRSLPFVLDCGYNYKEGSVVPVMENATARFGHAVIVGSRETIAENINTFYEKLSVKNIKGEEMILRLYPER